LIIKNNKLIGNLQNKLKNEHNYPKFKPSIKDIVKNHMDIIILGMLSDRPMCGYDLIKEILAKYDVLLSQGTVYPLLYSLKEEGLIQAEFKKGNMRSKIYYITPEAEKIIEKRISEFIKANTIFLNSIQNNGK
jgi:PadR family transcriptional regulator PadR